MLSDDALRAWLAPLGEREREVVALRYAAELPATEIAERSPASRRPTCTRSPRARCGACAPS